MKERPIIFSDAMVRALLAEQKTQTRRVIKPEWSRCLDLEDPDDQAKATMQCPYGLVGDRLWIRETWAHDDPNCDDVHCGNRDHIWWRANEEEIVANSFAGKAHWRSARFMPRWASRAMLEVVAVRVERLWDVRLEDIESEGTLQNPMGNLSSRNDGYARFRDFEWLWDSINAKRGYPWQGNPWVWVIEFKVVANGA